MQGNKEYGQQGNNSHDEAHRYGSIALGDAYEVHQFIAAQDMFTMEEAIDLVVAHNHSDNDEDTDVVPPSLDENDISVPLQKNLQKILTHLADLSGQDEIQDTFKYTPKRVGQGSASRVAAPHTQTHNTQTHPELSSDEYTPSSPLPGMTVYGPLAPSFFSGK